MFCIQLIYNMGGSKTVLGNTIEDCKKNCSTIKGDWLAATIPYEVEDKDWPFVETNSPLYDVSVPVAWWSELGVKLWERYRAE